MPNDSRCEEVSRLSGPTAISLQGFPDTLCRRVVQKRSYFSRKRLIRRKTAAYIAGVTRPVCVFC
jgi:hypothetical protein